MADPNATPDATSGSGATPDGEQHADDTQTTTTGATSDADVGDAGKRVIAEARRATKAAEQRAAELEGRLRELEDRDKSELEKARERTSAAEARVAELEHETRARTAAAAAGIADQWHRLRGSTEDELKSDAEALAEAFGKRGNGDDGAARDALDLGSGARSGGTATGNQAMNERIRRAAGRR